MSKKGPGELLGSSKVHSSGLAQAGRGWPVELLRRYLWEYVQKMDNSKKGPRNSSWGQGRCILLAWPGLGGVGLSRAARGMMDATTPSHKSCLCPPWLHPSVKR